MIGTPPRGELVDVLAFAKTGINVLVTYTTVMVACALNGQGRFGSNLIDTALATKLPPTVCAAISGEVP